MKTADNIDKQKLQMSIRNRQTRIQENLKLIEQHKFQITKLLLTIQHEQEALEVEQFKLKNKKGRNLL